MSAPPASFSVQCTRGCSGTCKLCSYHMGGMTTRVASVTVVLVAAVDAEEQRLAAALANWQHAAMNGQLKLLINKVVFCTRTGNGVAGWQVGKLTCTACMMICLTTCRSMRQSWQKLSLQFGQAPSLSLASNTPQFKEKLHPHIVPCFIPRTPPFLDPPPHPIKRGASLDEWNPFAGVREVRVCRC